MFNTAFGCFDTVADAAYGIEEYCSTDAAVSEAYDAAYDTFVTDWITAGYGTDADGVY